MRYQEAGLKPSMAQVVAGALKYTQYDFFKRTPPRYFLKPEVSTPLLLRTPSNLRGTMWVASLTNFSPSHRARAG